MVADKKKELLEMYCGNWIWRAVECLLDSKETHTVSSIAERLNISIENTVGAIEGLVTLGYIKWEDKLLVKVIPEYHIGNNTFEKKELIKIYSKLSPQIVAKLTKDDKFTTWFFLSNAEIVSKYAPKFMELYNSMMVEGLSKGATQVYASEISFAALSGGAK